MKIFEEKDSQSPWDWLEDIASLILVFGFCVIVAICLVGVYLMVR